MHPGEIAVSRPTWSQKWNRIAGAATESSITVPGSAIADWIRTAEKVVLIDGCFLRCHGRVLENLIGKEKLVQFDALSYYRKYTEHFDIDAVPEEERRETAKNVANAVLGELGKTTAGIKKQGAECGAVTSQKGRGCGCG